MAADGYGIDVRISGSNLADLSFADSWVIWWSSRLKNSESMSGAPGLRGRRAAGVRTRTRARRAARRRETGGGPRGTDATPRSLWPSCAGPRRPARLSRTSTSPSKQRRSRRRICCTPQDPDTQATPLLRKTCLSASWEKINKMVWRYFYYTKI